MPIIPHDPHRIEEREELLDHLTEQHGYPREDLLLPDPESLVDKHDRQHVGPMADPDGPVAVAGRHLGELIEEIDSSILLDWTPGTYEETLSTAVEALRAALAAAPDTPAAWAGRADAALRSAASALSALVDGDPALAGQLVVYWFAQMPEREPPEGDEPAPFAAQAAYRFGTAVGSLERVAARDRDLARDLATAWRTVLDRRYPPAAGVS